MDKTTLSQMQYRSAEAGYICMDLRQTIKTLGCRMAKKQRAPALLLVGITKKGQQKPGPSQTDAHCQRQAASRSARQDPEVRDAALLAMHT